MNRQKICCRLPSKLVRCIFGNIKTNSNSHKSNACDDWQGYEGHSCAHINRETNSLFVLCQRPHLQFAEVFVALAPLALFQGHGSSENVVARVLRWSYTHSHTQRIFLRGNVAQCFALSAMALCCKVQHTLSLDVLAWWWSGPFQTLRAFIYGFEVKGREKSRRAQWRNIRAVH